MRAGELINDDILARSIRIAAGGLGDDMAGQTHVDEDRLRDRLCHALAELTPARIEREKHVDVPGFQGVGPVDVVISNPDLGTRRGLVECKWSVDLRRDKIYEVAWDAIKLALALSQCDAGGWLVVGAPDASWQATEASDLFQDGEVNSRELWGRALYARGSNGGTTIGADCEAGGYGNMFTYAPERLRVRGVADVGLPDCQVRIKASRIVASVGPMIRFGDDPEFPARIGDSWLKEYVPSMSDEQFERLLARLRAKRWSDAELATRVLPLRGADKL